MEKQLKVNATNSYASYTDDDGDRLTVEILSNGQTAIGVRDNCMNDMVCLLSNRAAHELRDMLNRRFPNATAVQ